jgi:hypothetical protein
LRCFAVVLAPKQSATNCDIMCYGEFRRLRADSFLRWVEVRLATDIMQTRFGRSIRGWQRSTGQPAHDRKEFEENSLRSALLAVDRLRNDW